MDLIGYSITSWATIDTGYSFVSSTTDASCFDSSYCASIALRRSAGDLALAKVFLGLGKSKLTYSIDDLFDFFLVFALFDLS